MEISHPEASKKRIILVRHSESVNNVAKGDTYEAWKNIKTFSSLPSWKQVCSMASLLTIPMDTDLSDDGAVMVENLKRIMNEMNFLAQYQVELVVHSPLVRAARTCSGLFADSGVPMFQHAYIFEKDISEHLSISDINSRIEEFKIWLQLRPEKCIVVVGHSAFFRYMIKTHRKLKNCEVRSCWLLDDMSFVDAEILIPGGNALKSLNNK